MNYNKQHYDASNAIINHDWSGYLEHIGRLGVDPDSVDITPVIGILTRCIHQHYKESCELMTDNIQSLLDRTYQNTTSVSTEFNTREVFITSLNTFTNYIRHTFQPGVVTESSQCPSPVSSEVEIARLLNYSNISSPDSDSLHHGAASVNCRLDL